MLHYSVDGVLGSFSVLIGFQINNCCCHSGNLYSFPVCNLGLTEITDHCVNTKAGILFFFYWVIYSQDATVLWKCAMKIRGKDMSNSASPSRGKAHGMSFFFFRE